MRRRRLARAASTLAGAVVLLLTVTNAQAATWVVNIQGSQFVPSSVTIAQDDSVRWVNLDSVNHSCVSDTGVWTSPTLVHNAAYARQFTVLGTFQYHCGHHVGMLGTVIVNAVQTNRETWGKIKRLYEDR